MFRQYLEIKKLYPGTLLFFRLGDFYELFSEDAVTGSHGARYNIDGTTKGLGQSDTDVRRAPPCSVVLYCKIVRKGYRVAICEQAKPAAKGVKLVRREVVRVITPGTAIDPQLIDSREPVFLAALYGHGHRFGAAFLDLSTGEFSATEFEGLDAWDRIRRGALKVLPRGDITFGRDQRTCLNIVWVGMPFHHSLTFYRPGEFGCGMQIHLDGA